MSNDKAESWQKFLAASLQPGSWWRHYKGGIYTIVTLSVMEDSLEVLVTYRSVRKGHLWTRTLANFMEQVPYFDFFGQPKPRARFEPVPEGTEAREEDLTDISHI